MRENFVFYLCIGVTPLYHVFGTTIMAVFSISFSR